MPAPGGFGNVIEFAGAMDLTRLGALIPNSLMIADGQPSPRDKFRHTECGYLSAFGPNNISLARFIDEVLPALPEGIPPVIVDLKARSIREMAEVVRMAADAPGIGGIEVNLNCPYGTGEPLYSQDESQLAALLREARRAAGGKLLIAKAPGGFFPMAPMARVLEGEGADLFVSFNAIDGLSIDIRTRRAQGGGYFGPGIKPFALSRCREAVRAFQIPVIGAGGITRAEDVIEYILAGAFAVQVGSANLTRPDAMANMLDELPVLMESLGIDSLDAIRGAAQ